MSNILDDRGEWCDQGLHVEDKPNVLLGLFAAVVGVGIFGGMVPFWMTPTFVPSHTFVPAFGTAASSAIGTLIVFPIIAVLHLAYLKGSRQLPALRYWGLKS